MERWLNIKIYAGRSLCQTVQFTEQYVLKPFCPSLSRKAVDGLNNGLPQGSVLAPLLFSLYLSDIPSTLSNQFQYADDIALTYKHESFSDCEANLEVDLERLYQYFYRWRLQPNPSKTESCVFHLSKHITQTEHWTYNLLPRRFNTLSTLNILLSPTTLVYARKR
jgi:hypothetical protein